VAADRSGVPVLRFTLPAASMASRLLTGANGGVRATCCHAVTCSSLPPAVIRRAAWTEPFQHKLLHAAARRGGLICEAAKRPGAKKKKSPPTAKVQEREQQKAPNAAPPQTGTTTKERSEQRHAEQEHEAEQVGGEHDIGFMLQ